MRRTLRDPELESTLDQQGFVVVELLEAPALAELEAHVATARAAAGAGAELPYGLSFFHQSAELRTRLLTAIGGCLRPHTERFLADYEPLIANVFQKPPGSAAVPVHQNWTFVDEARFRSVSVWVPLVDVSRANGTLEVVPGSHRLLTPFRGPTIPWAFHGILEHHLQPLNLRRGQAAILDDSIIHFSRPNDSAVGRPAVQLIMRPAEALPHHCWANPQAPRGQLEILEVDAAFYASFRMDAPPQSGRSLGFAAMPPPPLTADALDERLRARP